MGTQDQTNLEPGSSILQLGVVPLQASPTTLVWNGAPMTLQAGESAVMASAPNGSAVFACQNMSTMNNAGAINIGSGSIVAALQPAAGASAPTFLAANWHAAQITVVNASVQVQTPIQIQLIGMGLPGINPWPLGSGGIPVVLGFSQCAQGNVPPRLCQFVVQATSGDRSTVAMIGGPPDATGSNSFLFGLNFPTNAGPGTPTPPPAGYFQTTTSNTILYQMNWPNGGILFCSNLSSEYANLPPQPLTVALRLL